MGALKCSALLLLLVDSGVATMNLVPGEGEGEVGRGYRFCLENEKPCIPGLLSLLLSQDLPECGQSSSQRQSRSAAPHQPGLPPPPTEIMSEPN